MITELCAPFTSKAVYSTGRPGGFERIESPIAFPALAAVAIPAASLNAFSCSVPPQIQPFVGTGFLPSSIGKKICLSVSPKGQDSTNFGIFNRIILSLSLGKSMANLLEKLRGVSLQAFRFNPTGPAYTDASPRKRISFINDW